MIARSYMYQDWAAIAKERWFSPEELKIILNNLDRIDFPSNFYKPVNPEDGSIFIYDRAVVPDFKQDGVEWRKKKGSNKIYELFIKLSCGGVHTITGLYYSATHQPMFRRRCYRLASREGYAVSQVYLVHYRDCRQDQPHCTVKGVVGASINSSSRQPAEGPWAGKEEKQWHNLFPLPQGDDDEDTCFGSLEDSALMHEMLEALDQGDFDSEVGPASTQVPPSPFSAALALPVSEGVRVVDMSPGAGGQRGGTKLLMCFSGPLLPPGQDLAVRVLFTPISGLKRGQECQQARGSPVWSPGELLGPSALRCHSPPCPPCRCHVSVMSAKGVELAASDVFFEYTTEDVINGLGTKKRLSRGGEELGQEQEEDLVLRRGRRSHKIRLVERLLGEREGSPALLALSSSGSSGQEEEAQTEAGGEGEWLDDAELLGLSSADLEGLMDQFLLRVVQQLVHLAGEGDQGEEGLLAGELNALDASGYSLLHYCCLFSLTSLVARLIDQGADKDLRTRGRSTPLHLAAASGHTDVVSQLVHAGALLLLEDAQGLTAAALAEQKGFSHIRLLLDETALGQDQHVKSQAGYSSTVTFGCTPPKREAGGNNHISPLSVSPADISRSSDGSCTPRLSLTNLDLLHGALSSLSLTDKCALSLSLQGHGGAGTGPDQGLHGGNEELEVQSVLSHQSDVESLDLAMSLMAPRELLAVEDEVKVIQSNVRTWLLRKNYTNLRDAAKTLQVAWRERRGTAPTRPPLSSRRGGEDMAGITSGEGRNMDASAATLTLQAATRGMLARRSFQRAKKQTMASLVIFKWWGQSRTRVAYSSQSDREEVDVEGSRLRDMCP